MPPAPDAELLATRNREIEELVAALRPLLLRILSRARIPPANREDLLQDALLALVRRWPEIRSPHHWLLGTVSTLSRDYWRNRRRPSHRLLDFPGDGLLIGLAGTVPPVQDARAALLDLAPYLVQLPSSRRTILLGHVLGYSDDHLAGVTGYAPRSIRGVLSSVRSRLRKSLLQAFCSRA